MQNQAKRKLKPGQATAGAWVGLVHPEVTEIMAQMGFDWLVFPGLTPGQATLNMLLSLSRRCRS